MITPTRSWPAPYKVLHWTIGLLIIGLLGVGLYMTRMEFSPLQIQLYGLHKAVGITILGLVVVRIIWRSLITRPPELVSYKKWERVLATVIHTLLYAAMIGMPVSGWIISSATNFPVNVFGFFTLPPLVGPNEELAHRMEMVHEYLGYGLILAVGLHIAGALKHHVIDRDVTLLRMLPRTGSAMVIVMIVGFIGFLSAAQIAQSVITPVEQEPLVAKENSREFSAADEDEFVNEAEVPPVEVAEWAILPQQSTLVFTATQQGAKFDGKFAGFDGRIRFDAEQLQWSLIDVTVDIGSVKTGSEERDQTMVAKDWLSAETYPVARFQSNQILEGTEGGYMARGLLTIKGVSQPVDLPFTVIFMEKDGKSIAKAQGEFTIQRLAFNVGEGEWGKDTKAVGDDVTVTIDLTAEKK